MKKIQFSSVLFIVIFQILIFIPYGEADNNDVEWIEEITISGNCSTQNIRRHIDVNQTVVEIIVNLTWGSNSLGANLDMWMERTDGYVVNASDSEEMPEIMHIRDFPDRGRWTLVIIPTSCGTTGEAHFTANVSLRNIALPKLIASKTEIEVEDNVTLSLESVYQNVSQYFFDFGDNSDSGWIGKNSVTKEYEKEGKYFLKGKVRYSDGSESEWVEIGAIDVKNDLEELDILFLAQITLILLIIFSVLIFLIIKKRKGF